MRRIFFLSLGFLLSLGAKPLPVLGLSLDDFRKEVFRPDNLPGGTVSGSAEGRLNALILNVVNFILFASGSIAVALLVIGGIRYIVSLGNQERMDAAKKTITYALIGLAVIILAYAAVTNIIDLIYRSTV